MNTLILFMSPPGSGKSELAEYLSKRLDNSIIINKPNFYLQYKSEKDYYLNVKKMLETKKYVILDSCNVLLEDRERLFSYLDTDSINIIGIWVEINKNSAKERNAKRLLKDQVQEKDIDYLYKYRVSPTFEEPFDDIIYIMWDANIGMSKSYPYLTSALGVLDRIGIED